MWPKVINHSQWIYWCTYLFLVTFSDQSSKSSDQLFRCKHRRFPTGRILLINFKVYTLNAFKSYWNQHANYPFVVYYKNIFKKHSEGSLKSNLLKVKSKVILKWDLAKPWLHEGYINGYKIDEIPWFLADCKTLSSCHLLT